MTAPTDAALVDAEMVAEWKRLNGLAREHSVDPHLISCSELDTLLRLAEDGVRLREAMAECAAECERQADSDASIAEDSSEHAWRQAAALILSKLNGEVRA